MYLPFSYFETERTVFSDNSFGIIGRALTFATYFESICRGLSTLIDLKSKHKSGKFSLENDEELQIFLHKLERYILYQHIEKISQYYEFDKDIKSLIHKAKNARNFIVHELTLGIEEIIHTDESRHFIIESLKEKITDIAKANILLIIMICLETHEEIPTPDYLKKYPNMISTWVLDVDDFD